MSADTLSTGDSFQDELHSRLLHCRPGDRGVASYAFGVKRRCGYFRSDVRNLLWQRGLGYVEESDVTDADWVGETADSAADLVNK